MDSTLESAFENVAWKLAELDDILDAGGYDLEDIRIAQADLYEAKTHLRPQASTNDATDEKTEV